MRYDRIIFKGSAASGISPEPSIVGHAPWHTPPDASPPSASSTSAAVGALNYGGGSGARWVATDIRLIGGAAEHPEAEPTTTTTAATTTATSSGGGGIGSNTDPVDGFSTPPPKAASKRLHIDTSASPIGTTQGLHASDHFGLFATFTYR